MIDVFFLSYDEEFADANFERLKQFAPHAKRVHGVKGIFEAHKECAVRAETENFYVVDADAYIEEYFTFNFEPQPDRFVYGGVPETDCVFVWRSRNPVNDLIYGYGGVKLFPKKALLDAEKWNVDMTTTIGATFVPKMQISNVTAFNSSPYNTWKSAFRECTKLASNIIPNGNNLDTEYRLNVWMTKGKNRPFGKYSIIGAKQGADFGLRYKDKPHILAKINDFDWLKKIYDEYV